MTLDRVVNTGDGQFDPNLTPMLAGTSSCPDTFTIASSRRYWQATVVSGDGEEIALTGRYDEVSEPDRLVMTVPGGFE